MKNSRTTFGIIIDWPDQDSSYQMALLSGIKSFAVKNDINLLTLATGRLDSPHSWEKTRETLYDFVQRDDLFSGFILFSSTLSSLSGTKRLKEKISGLTKLPIVSLTVDLEDQYVITINNEPGFEELVEHLIVHHGYKNIAHISGPLKHEEAATRWEIIQRITAKHGLTIPESHFYEGKFTMKSGTDGIKWFMDESKIMPEVIITANDNMALGAWQELKRRNISVPGEIAVTGFDDLQVSPMFDLPFTTVRQPLYRQGWEAAKTLFSAIQGLPTERVVELSTETVYRLSCGCLHGRQTTAKESEPMGKPEYDAFFEKEKEKFITAVEREVSGMQGSPLARSWNKTILSAIEHNIRQSEIYAFIESIQDDYKSGSYGAAEKALVASYQEKMKLLANDFYIQSDLLNRITTETSNKLAINQIESIGDDNGQNDELNYQLSTISNILPQLQIQTCYISLFNHLEYKQNGSSNLVFAYVEGKEIAIPESKSTFKTETLLNRQFLPKNRFDLLFEVLFDNEQNYGLVCIDMNAKGPDVFEMIRIRLTTIIRASIERQHLVELNRQLKQQISVRQKTEKKLQQALNALQDLSLTDELTSLYNRRGFMTMGEQQLKYCQRENEHFIVFFIDMDGLKGINDRYGHNEGDNAIVLTSEILNSSFRETDIIARLGGDEFTIFATKADEESVQMIKQRIQYNCDIANSDKTREYSISMSIGTYISSMHEDSPDSTLDEILNVADRELYKMKRKKKGLVD